MTDARYREALERLSTLSVRQAQSDQMDAALAIICEALEVPMGKILQLVEGGTVLLVRWGVGWKQGVAGHSIVSANTTSLAGYAIAQDEVVVVDDVMATSRFAEADLLRLHEVQSSLAARIACRGQAWGVLTLHERRRRRFSQAEVAFFKEAAAELGALIPATT